MDKKTANLIPWQLRPMFGLRSLLTQRRRSPFWAAPENGAEERTEPRFRPPSIWAAEGRLRLQNNNTVAGGGGGGVHPSTTRVMIDMRRPMDGQTPEGEKVFLAFFSPEKPPGLWTAIDVFVVTVRPFWRFSNFFHLTSAKKFANCGISFVYLSSSGCYPYALKHFPFLFPFSSENGRASHTLRVCVLER